MKKIAAVVVTYNRKELLERCIKSLLGQSLKLDKIFIIDNAGTDRTYEYLKKQNLLDQASVNYIRLLENTGGAGGFYYGLKLAHEEGYDYYYMMDDDGIPETDALYKLMQNAKQYSLHYINSLVVDISNHKKLSFSLEYQNKVITERSQIESLKCEILTGTANPFNGLLLTKKLVDKVGYPKKEMFIWGDEIEYMLRVESAGYMIATGLNAIHYHPSLKADFVDIIIGKFKVVRVKGIYRTYIKHRNRAYICTSYSKKGELFKWIIKYTWFFLITEHGDLKMFNTFLAAIRDGKRGLFLDNQHLLEKLNIPSITL